MPIIKKNLNISGNTGIPPIVTLKQYDKTTDSNGKQLQITLYDGATLYTIPTGSRVTIRGTKPDLTGYAYECSFTGSVVTVNIDEQMTVCAGRHNAEIRVEKDGNILGTASLTLNVEKSALTSDVSVSKTYLPLIEQAGQNVNDIKTFYEATKEMYEKLAQMSYAYKTDGMSQLELETTARYETARTGKVFATKHYKFAVNTTSYGDKILDSAGLTCTPSTDKTVGQDDFIQYLPFQWEHVNYVRDEDDGFARPVAIEGRPNYKTSGSVDVGTMSATFWWKYVEDETTYTIYLSDMPHPELGLIPWCEAVKADGTVYPYYIGSAYPSVIGEDGLLRSLPNLSPAYNQSHNGNITAYQKKGAGYWGAGTEFVLHGLIFSEIKYGTANIQQYGQGCTGYSFQTKCSVAETGVKRVLSKTQWGADIGNVVSVGVARTSDGNIDRGVSEIHSKANRVRIASIEQVEIDGTTYYALNLECEETFDTDTDTIVSSMPCYSGETDAVIDHYDGSKYSNTNARHTFRLHGREYLNGLYFVASNAVLLMKDGDWHVMFAPKGTKRNAGLTGYSDGGVIPYNDGTDYWIGDWKGTYDGIAYPSAKGSSNSLGVGDMIYIGANNAAEGSTREYLLCGALRYRSNAGLLFVSCRDRLGSAGWHFGSRD